MEPAPMLSRRRLLAAPLLPLARLGVAAADEAPPLKDLARAKGILYGCCVTAAQLAAGDDFTALVLRECACLVAENEMKWQWMSHREGEADYTMPDRIIEFATSHGLALRGHNLLWYWRTPDWFKDLRDPAAAEAAMLRRIFGMVGRYRGRIRSWDVVNEPTRPRDGRPDALRTAVFLERLGPQYLDRAYRAAREADPTARLVVNEYDLVYADPPFEAKRAAVLRLLERMKAAGTPVDALGVQAHLAARRYCFAAPPLRRFLADVAALGLEIEVTELDCTDEYAPPAAAERDRWAADEYRRFLEVALAEPAVKVLMTWGLADRHSWIVRHENNPAGQRSDGLPSRPLPFDAALARKPAWSALAEALRGAPPR
jgi:endo-1,4-beta-xylanase